MIYNRIGNTGLDVSLIGLGTVKFGRNTGIKYPNSFDIPDDKTTAAVLQCAADCGINLIDTAPAYGNSEERLGLLLPKITNDWLICTKVGEFFNPTTAQSHYDFSPEVIQKSIYNSLKKLNRDYLDIVLIHSDGNDLKIIQEDGALDVLNDLQQKGLIRATGMSTKTVEGGAAALKKSDIAMITHNLKHKSEAQTIAYAHENHKGILIKKAFDSGHASKEGDDFVKKSFDCILKNQGVSSIVLGSINTKHIRSNTSIAMKYYNSQKKLSF